MAQAPQLRDVALNAVGDISVGYNGDLAIVRDEEAVARVMAFRLKTHRGDFVPEPQCGANLEDLIGQPNSPETGSRLEEQITEALTHDGFLGSELTQVTAVPISRHQLAAVIQVEYEDVILHEEVVLDLQEGVLI